MRELSSDLEFFKRSMKYLGSTWVNSNMDSTLGNYRIRVKFCG